MSIFGFSRSRRAGFTMIGALAVLAVVAFPVFLVIRLMNQRIRKEAAKPPAPSRQEELLTEIRDVLKSQPR